jgi:hypothetical protein
MAKGGFTVELCIDWPEFRRQQRTLRKLLNEDASLTSAQRTHLDRIRRLLNTIQDAGVESGDFTEEQVYGR